MIRGEKERPGGGGDLRGDDWFCWDSGDTSSYAALSPSIAMTSCTKQDVNEYSYVYVEREYRVYGQSYRNLEREARVEKMWCDFLIATGLQ